ncbi:acyltransferase family protein [Actinospica robiniae]|uniref:acyltransferase family protein n=1 Tax=Actinospica robiniae TaxID=304901 RepID=UPI00146FBF40|nr:acyltransferase family protein [Actinospica robiniae]
MRSPSSRRPSTAAEPDAEPELSAAPRSSAASEHSGVPQPADGPPSPAEAEPSVEPEPAAGPGVPAAGPRVAALDGLRGLAVALVVVFHVFPNTLPGGFLGVDVFFVLSGFLITGLLVPRLRSAPARPVLRRFWLGRARRLAPELIAVLVAVCVVAGYATPGFGAGLRAQVAAASVSGMNWLLIGHGQDYFAAFAAAAGHPPALQHLWSLAVEEQFYLLWPFLLRLVLRTPFPALLTAAGSGASFALMAAQSDAGTTDYYSTLTHCGGLLLGAAVALRLPLDRIRALDPRSAPEKLRVVGRFGLGGLVILLLLAACLNGETSAPERGGIVLASFAALAVLLAAACETDVARILRWRPIVHLGARSYGVYLWHWPLIVLLGTPGTADGASAATGRAAAELVLPLVLASLSHRVFAAPARRFDPRAAWRRLRGRTTTAAAWKVRTATGLAAAALVPAIIGLADAPRIDPQQSAMQAQISAGSAVAAASVTGTGASAAPSAGATPGPSASASAGGEPQPRDPAASGGLPAAGPPDPVLGEETTAVGDSVLLASAEALTARMPGIVIDAKVGRQIYEATDVLEDLAASGRLRHFVVLALGTNGDTTEQTLDEIKRIIGPGRVLVLITVHVPRSWQGTVNDLYVNYVVSHRDSLLVDWNATISQHPALLWTDDTHPRPSGAQVYANLLADDLARAAD